MSAAPRSTGAVAALLGPYRVLRGNRALGLLFGGQVVSAFGDRLYITVVMVLAYDLTHSATIVALLNLMRLLPNAILLPFAGVLADRFNRKALMITADLGRGACMLGLLTVSTRGTMWIAFPLIFVTTALLSLFRPALNAVVPAVVADDEKLMQANALMSQIEALAFVLGPSLAGVLILLGQLQVAFAINAASYLVSAGTLLFLAVPPRAAAVRPAAEEGWMAETLAGFRFLFRENEGVLGAVTLPFAGFQIYEGAFWALIVVLTEQVWRLGSQGIGFINTAYGVGGLLGGFLASVVASKVRSGTTYSVAIAARSVVVLLFGLSVAGAWPFIWQGLMGTADVLALILGVTIIQMATPRDLLGRSCGAFESTSLSAKVLGTLIAGPLIDAVGARATAVILALLALTLLAVCLPRIRRLEAVLGVRLFLRRVPVLRALSRVALDAVAQRLQLEHLPAQTTIVRQGEPGDALYIIKSGTVQVLLSRADGREAIVATLSTMDYFGEIALLRDVPRTATVRSRGPVELYRLTRADFQELMRRSDTLHQGMAETGDARYRETQAMVRLLR